MKHTIVMTGASRGIGAIAARHILSDAPDAQLVVIGRAHTAAQTATDLRTGGHPTSYVAADLGSLEGVRSATAQILDRLRRGELPPLHGFVGNAGIQYTNALTEGPDGFEATFAVNVLANHLLIRLLQEHFVAPARIVITTSDTHFGDFRHNLGMVPGPAWRSPDLLARPAAFPEPQTAAAGRTAYSTSKLAVIYLVHEYARRLPAGIDVVSYNPGFVPGTDLARDAGPVVRFAVRRILPVMTATPFANSRFTAGRHLADLVLGRTEAPTGSYVDRGRAVRSSRESYDLKREAELWAVLEQSVAAHLSPTPNDR